MMTCVKLHNFSHHILSTIGVLIREVIKYRLSTLGGLSWGGKVEAQKEEARRRGVGGAPGSKQLTLKEHMLSSYHTQNLF